VSLDGSVTARILIAAGVILCGCHRSVSTSGNEGVRHEVKDTTAVTIRNAKVAAFFRDTAPSMTMGGRGRTNLLEVRAERTALRATIERHRELWRSAKPANYGFLLRVSCFCPGPRGWLWVEVRGLKAVRAWDRNGGALSLTDWNTISIDDLYDNLERGVDRDGEVQIDFDSRWNYPSYVRTNAARVPDSWSILDARALRPLP
jgi:hypothetical protein